MTTTEVATIDDTEFISNALTTVDPFDTLNRYADMLAKSLKFAQDVCRTSLVPKIYQNKPGDAAVAILHGTELGLHPLQALQNIFSVHGMPAIYAKTMVALLKAKGYRFQTQETGPDKVTLQAWSPSGKETETSTWTIARATQAGFVPTIDPETGKYKTKKFKGQDGPYEKLIGNEKYITQPEEMLYAKAASTVCRRLAPHILLGLAFVEDMEDAEASEPEPVRATSERVTPTPLPTADAAPAAGPVVQQWQPPATDEEPVDAETTSEEGEKPDTAQVEDSAQASPEPASEMATTAEQRALSDQLERHGHKAPAAKRAYLTKETGRKIGSAKDLHGFEARAITERLTALADPEQVAALRRALEVDNVHAEGKQLDWIRDNAAPDLGDWGDLAADIAVDLTVYLRTEQAKDAARASAQTALDADGAGQ
ncbi:hypothetical protein [Nocardia pseudovaccinii]|uniref:hypothetical protein n=1 Tax=Nocardia pseudovaccinii TaxID=189540 RepID=UPI000A3FA4C0|nr:hypothetical protein [Nocardia pseudovaccinii]